MLNPYVCHDYASKDNMFEFAREIIISFSNNKFVVSYDVKSLLACISLKETVDIAVNTILEKKKKSQNLKTIFSQTF